MIARCNEGDWPLRCRGEADGAAAAGDRALPGAVAVERAGGVDEEGGEDEGALAGLRW